MYLGISQAAISSVLVRDDAGTQRPVYYVSRALRGAELRYSPTEKAIFVMDTTSKKLGHYFQAHPVRVLTNQPLEAVLRASGSGSGLIKWSTRLSQYNVQFKPRPAIKGQALTAREATELARSDEDDWWTLSTDGSSGPKGCGGGVVLVTPEGFRTYYALCFHFKLSNNEADNEALLGGLRLALGLRASKVRVRCDSRLLVGQVNGEFEANEERMRRYRDVVLQLLGQLTLYEILQYKRTGTLPADEADAKAVKWRSPTYVLLGDTLYKRSYNGSVLRCLYPEEAKFVKEKIHEGTCAAHQGAFATARRALLQGYFWPKMAKECAEYARGCPTCQHFHAEPGRLATSYTPISTVIPFSRWGIDIVGALPMGSAKRKYIMVAIDYFTKWVEVEPLATITSTRCTKFIRRNILYRFGVPMQIISDKRRQFESKEFKAFCDQWYIKHTRVTVAYPQANGQVENANRIIVDGIKKNLGAAGGTWVEELDTVLWVYRTTPRRATRETPFALVNGFEARAPTEAVIPSYRVSMYDPDLNEGTPRR
ncbi:PREDICTED: uncharacterized protein LOC109186059 [Ipomoea nil]|uniref:uncharacterized protein LOC109186059 n=1 Tax=Ipomoea nil TaxID=35883 RepID=UPI000901CBC7|nr:PREDICTED: uncharacterized protein LOC109186059 [Ipomoea nil]